MNDTVWTPDAVDVAMQAHDRRIASFAGGIFHPDTYREMKRWAMLEALNAAADRQYSGIVSAKGFRL